MGVAHRDAIRFATVGTEGSLEMDSLSHSGLSSTSPTDSGTPVTDSAAGGTAIATGVKTRNGAVGVNAKGKPVTTLLEKAKKMGKSTGLVTTSQVTDATPAAFAAHVESRSDQSEIARQYLEETKPDVILGGGEDYWYPEGNPGAHSDSSSENSEEGSRGHKGDLVKKAKSLGYDYVADAEGLDSAGGSGSKILGLFANAEMFVPGPEGEGAAYDPTVPLPDMTRKAIEVLSENEKGFFLVVEEEAIDEMSHANNAELTLKSGKQLDKSVGIAKDYADNNPDTLLIVAADHETGGMSLEALDQGKPPVGPGEDGPFQVSDSELQFSIDWTTDDHTATDVPITAEGPGSEKVEGVYENTHLYHVIKESLSGDSQ